MTARKPTALLAGLRRRCSLSSTVASAVLRPSQHASLSSTRSTTAATATASQCHRSITTTSIAAQSQQPSFMAGPYIGSQLPQIDSTQLTITKTTTPRKKLPPAELKFGQLMSDHMLNIDWDFQNGWHAPEIVPYQPLALDPAASVLHYALECFEGMKAYVDSQNQIRLYRPEKNMARMNKSAARLLMPGFNGEEFIKCIEELVKVDKSWIPVQDGYSLYIRPTLISTHPYLGVAPSQSAKLYVITSPVGPYYPTGFAPISVLAEHRYARAWPGGTGDSKIGGNYAITIKPAYEAALKGYGQILWLVGKEHVVSEVGTMNIFFVWQNKQTGRKELVTAPLDGTVLPGVTRMSILELVKQWGDYDIVERNYTIHEVIDALNEGRLIESFGAGTAAVVSPVNKIAFQDHDYDIPIDKDNPKAAAGKLTKKVWEAITDIQYGRTEHPWSRVVQE